MENNVLELVNFYLKLGGLPLIFLIIFIETGIFLGFFLPGDSLLFTLGLLIAAKILPLEYTIIGCIIAAVLGNYTGYFIGSFLYDSLKNKFFYKYEDKILKAKEFYDKYGFMAIIYARFIPFFRGFIPLVAGIVKMNFIQYTIYNIISAILWVVSLVLLGIFLGKVIPDIEKYIYLIILAIIVISLLPVLIKFIKSKKIQN
ncbi:MAG: DedA family protein [bacterium]|nr:DedA family protein [bacterium]